MVWLNITVRFVVELLGLGFVGYWGFNVSDQLVVQLAAGIGAAVAFAVVWGLFLAPNATRGGLSTRLKNILGTIVLLVAAAAVAVAGQPAVAVVYAVVVILNAAALLVLGDRVTNSLDRFGRPG